MGSSSAYELQEAAFAYGRQTNPNKAARHLDTDWGKQRVRIESHSPLLGYGGRGESGVSATSSSSSSPRVELVEPANASKVSLAPLAEM